MFENRNGMDARRARRLLLWAFVLSVLVHLIGVRAVHWSVPAPVEAPDRLTMSRVAIIHMPRHTAPPATPKPVAAATPAPKTIQMKTRIDVPLLTTRSLPGHGQTVATLLPAPTATPIPTPTPSPKPSASASAGCVTANAPAAVRSAAPVPEIPLAARQGGKTGIVAVRVHLTESGGIAEAVVEQGSGNDALDQVAVAMAKTSTYAPPLAQCKAVAGTYLFRVKLTTPQ
ncbi:MAG: TonB family protein [Candidatus Eremiobacteraeota bacterium]|nr:TonB family protein [Candidatus Eremiobacteraeota bacterium]